MSTAKEGPPDSRQAAPQAAPQTAERILDVIAALNEEGTRARVLRWCKQSGDTVRRDEPLLELETDKVTVEVPSPAAGVLAEILKRPNEEVLPGEVLARLRVAESKPSVSAPAPSEPPSPRTSSVSGGAPESGPSEPAAAVQPQLSPAVRKLLGEHGLAPAQVAGSGRDGRITVQDIERHVGAGAAAGSRLPHTPIRRRVAEHMARSLAQAPHVTTLFEVDMTRVQAHRARHADEFERAGARLTLTAYFIAACAHALRVHPRVNASFHEDALELYADANIGVGTALGDEGLIVPVIHRAQTLDLLGIARRLGELVAAARAGKLAPEEVRGGTFTLSNHGVGGSLLAAPIIINQPQFAVLGIGKVERRLRVLEAQAVESIAIRSMCYLTLTIDHRALDAFQANAFLAHIVGTLEGWS